MKKRVCEEVPLRVVLSPSELSRANCAVLGGCQGSTRRRSREQQHGHSWEQLPVQLYLSGDCCSSKTLGSSEGRAGKPRGCWPRSLTRLIIPFPTEQGRRAQKSNCVLLLSEKRMRCCLGSLERLIIAFLTVIRLKRIEPLPSKYSEKKEGRKKKTQDSEVQRTIPTLVLFAHDTGSAQT